jgi:hypothetical protein
MKIIGKSIGWRKKMKDSEINIISKEAIKRAIFASAPEREIELIQLLDKYDMEVHFDKSDDKFNPDTAYGVIRFRELPLKSIWILGFSAQKAFQTYSPFLLISQKFDLMLSSEILMADQETKKLIEELHSYLSPIEALLDALLEDNNNIIPLKWPQDIPKPEKGKPNDIYGSMAFDLNCIAAAYCFLHEYKHVIIYKENEEKKVKENMENIDSLDDHEEEIQCDSFARDMLLSQIGEFSRVSGYTVSNLKNKRAMGIALASFLMLVVTSTGNWLGTQSHPSIIERIRYLTNLLDENDTPCCIYLSCLILALMDKRGIKLNRQRIVYQKEFCLNLLKQLEEESRGVIISRMAGVGE